MRDVGLVGLIIDGDMNAYIVGDFDVELKAATYIVEKEID